MCVGHIGHTDILQIKLQVQPHTVVQWWFSQSLSFTSFWGQCLDVKVSYTFSSQIGENHFLRYLYYQSLYLVYLWSSLLSLVIISRNDVPLRFFTQCFCLLSLHLSFKMCMVWVTDHFSISFVCFYEINNFE